MQNFTHNMPIVDSTGWPLGYKFKINGRCAAQTGPIRDMGVLNRIADIIAENDRWRELGLPFKTIIAEAVSA